MICHMLTPLAFRALISLSDDIRPNTSTVDTSIESGTVKRSMSGIMYSRKRPSRPKPTPFVSSSKARKK